MVKATTTQQDWVDAAYSAFLADGLAAVRVEPLARVLGATKGSFYWHFADRAALVGAVVERWEAQETDAVIALAEAGGTPAQRSRGVVRGGRADAAHARDRAALHAGRGRGCR